ncbi:hypothetical protein ACP9OK_10875 [Pseudomonas sp. B11]
MKVWWPERALQYSFGFMWLLGALSAVVWTVVGSVGYWSRIGWLPVDAAGWAQAFGAIVAIVVAIAIPYFQQESLRKQKEETELKARLDGINATYALMIHVSDIYTRLKLALRVLSFANNPLDWKAVAHDLKQSAAMLREIPVTAISNEMVHFLVGLREVSNYGEFLSGLMDYPNPSLVFSLEIIDKVDANVSLVGRWVEELELLENSITRLNRSCGLH